MQDSFSMNRIKSLFLFIIQGDLQFFAAVLLGLRKGTREKMRIKMKFFSRYLWLLSLSTILPLWLFYMRWTHVWHMNATKLRWAKPYTFLNFQLKFSFRCIRLISGLDTFWAKHYLHDNTQSFSCERVKMHQRRQDAFSFTVLWRKKFLKAATWAKGVSLSVPLKQT